MTVTGNFIDGQWIPSASGATLENRNPADTTQLIGLFADSTSKDAELAISAAKRAFASWRLVPAPLEVFSEWKSIYVDFSGKLQRAQIDDQ